LRRRALTALRAFAKISSTSIVDKISAVLKAKKHHLDKTETQEYDCSLLAAVTSANVFKEIMTWNCKLLVRVGRLPILTASLKNSVEVNDNQYFLILSLHLHPISILQNFSTIGKQIELPDAEVFLSTLSTILHSISWLCYIFLSTPRQTNEKAAITQAGRIDVILQAIQVSLSDKHLGMKHLPFSLRALIVYG
jgi:hypothetical protein